MNSVYKNIIITLNSLFLPLKYFYLKISLNIRYLFVILCFTMLLLPQQNLKAQFYNGTHTSFGKNRVQYDSFEWKYYRFSKYETYFYKGGKELAIFTAKTAKVHLEEQEKLFEYYLKDKIQFVIYNKQSHFKQSNVGLALENGEMGGITTIMGSKVFLYFNGNHDDLEKQIKQGIAKVMINQQVFGNNWRQVLKNSSLLTLPDWYFNGLTDYVSGSWNSEIEGKVRDGMISGKYKKFNRLTKDEATIAGHSLWKYIVDTYGEGVLPNILYMNRVTQSVDRGFLYVLGVSMKSLTKEWKVYYGQEFSGLSKSNIYKDYEAIKVRKNRVYQQFKRSPDGNYHAYVTNQLGQYKLYIHSEETGKHKKIYKKEFKLDRINDYSYPVLAWHPTSKILSFVTEEKGALFLNYYDVETEELTRKVVFRLEKILSFDYADNGKQMVFSGVYNGQSDLYLYHTGSNSQKNITNDAFDALNPKFIENSTKIIYTSNRTSDSLGYQPNDDELLYNKHDVWIVNNFESKVKTLSRVTNTPNVSEVYPIGSGSEVMYLAEKNNILTKYDAVKDSFITHIDTIIHYNNFYEPKQVSNYERGIEYYDVINDKHTEIIYDNGKYHLIDKKYEDLIGETFEEKTEIITTDTIEKEVVDSFQIEAELLKNIKIEQLVEQEGEVDINNYLFIGEKKLQRNVPVKGSLDTIPYEFKLPNQRNYNLSFFNDNTSVRLSNSFENGEYQVFTGGPFIAAGIGATMKLGVADLFEDYKVYGGIRFSGATMEYFMSFQDYLKRMDKEYTISRTVSNMTNGNEMIDFVTNTAHYSLRYPFSEVSSVRATLSGRHDRAIVKSTDIVSLTTGDYDKFKTVLKAAYVFDNTRHKAMNIYFGTKFKVFAEYYQGIFGDDKDFQALINPNAVYPINGHMQVFGFDLRHSQQLIREFVWVNRLAASSSFGSEKLIYYLGSLDDWIAIGQQQFINSEDLDLTIPYRYHALAANLRGFSQNIRRGTNFAVFNSELRLPLFKFFIRRPIKSSFIRNFQLVSFADIGTAWNGLNPWDKENSINKEIITEGPIKVTVFKNTEPLVAGYGFGLRTTMLGYFIRADWAWGVEDWVSNDKYMFYLSLSLDF